VTLRSTVFWGRKMRLNDCTGMALTGTKKGGAIETSVRLVDSAALGSDPASQERLQFPPAGRETGRLNDAVIFGMPLCRSTEPVPVPAGAFTGGAKPGIWLPFEYMHCW